MIGLSYVRALLLLAMSMPTTQVQRQTIPDAVAEGAVSSVATVPSGQVPTMSALLPMTDIIVTGIIGEPRSYLSEDKRDVYTDYLIGNPVFLYESKLAAVPRPGMVQNVTVTQLGGTVMVNGTKFTQKEPALLPLGTGANALFLLHRSGDKYLIVGKYFGAFRITDGRLVPLVTREDFAPEYRNKNVSVAVDAMMTTLRVSGR
jgi:hypothetical protein